jgi:hypothetical protein
MGGAAIATWLDTARAAIAAIPLIHVRRCIKLAAMDIRHPWRKPRLEQQFWGRWAIGENEGRRWTSSRPSVS